MACHPKVIKLKTILAFTGCRQHCCCFFQMIPWKSHYDILLLNVCGLIAKLDFCVKQL